jgi:hypothetical protein
MLNLGNRLQFLGYSLLSFFFLLFTVTCTLSTVFAVDVPNTKPEFATTYDVIYDIDSEGVTTVTEKISLRNLTSESYANQFKLIIGATQVTDIKASDGGGAMKVSSEQKDTSTIISVKFNQQVAGLGKVLPWTLQFKSKDFAEKIGKVWELRAPKITSTTNLENYNLTLSVPKEFGDPTIISPIPKSQTSSEGKMFLTFTKDQLTQSGISASFGQNQLFDFDLSYHLENKNLIPILTSVALPPDTAFQDVIYQRIEPQPINVTVDDDGNYLAWFRLNRGEKKDIKVVGSSKLYTQSKVKNPTLNDNLKKLYTQQDKYWEKDHPEISQKLNEILGPNPPQDSHSKARLIFNFVVGSLKYNSTRLQDTKNGVERLGAVTALSNPNSAVCMEFTDLFIALSRAAGIPARELDGFAYTANPTLRPLSLNRDILHSWPEFWDDKKGWIMVDPTWENTTGGVDYFNKLDLNHFVFVIKGASSEQPIPAGSYKYIGQNSKDVKVELGEFDFLGKANLDVSINVSDPIWAGFPGRVKVQVTNVGNTIYNSPNFSVKASRLTILDGNTQILGPIPPFGTATFDLNIRTKSLFDNFTDQIDVLIGGQIFTKDVEIKPFLIFQSFPAIAILIISSMGIIYFIILGSHIYKHRHKSKVKTPKSKSPKK